MMEDIVVYSAEYHVEILSVAVCQMLLGWPNKKKKVTPKTGRLIYVSLTVQMISVLREKVLKYKSRIGQCGNCFTLPEVNCSLKLKDIKLSRPLDTCTGEHDGVALTFL